MKKVDSTALKLFYYYLGSFARRANTLFISSIVLFITGFGQSVVYGDAFAPVFDSSSGTTIDQSYESFKKYAETSNDITFKQKREIPLVLDAIRAQLLKEITGDDGVKDLTPRELDRRVSIFYKKYNGLKPLQLVDVYLKEAKDGAERAAAEHSAMKSKALQEEEMKTKALQDKRNRQEQLFAQRIDVWLRGESKAAPELEGYGVLQVEGRDAEMVVSHLTVDRKGNNQTKKILSADFNKTTRTLGNIRLSQNSHGYMRDRKALFPSSLCGVRQEQELRDQLWFLPKFKEWALKFEGLKDEEKPENFVKEFKRTGSPSKIVSEKRNQDDAGTNLRVSPVFFLYQKSFGSGVLVWPDEDGMSRGEYEYLVPVLDNEKLDLKWLQDGEYFEVAELSPEVSKKYPYQVKPMLSRFRYFRTGDLYLAEALLDTSLYLNAPSQSNSKGLERSDADAKKSSLMKKLDLE